MLSGSLRFNLDRHLEAEVVCSSTSPRHIANYWIAHKEDY